MREREQDEHKTVKIDMKLLNFKLAAPSFAIELIALDSVWDLHNAGVFLGFDFQTKDNTVVMRWNISDGPVAAKYSGCKLVFGGVKLIEVSRRAEEFPYTEDSCISGISKVVPEPAEETGLRTKHQWDANDPFHLVFEFQSARSIEIDAETAAFVGETR
ncbi:MAG TPA: hypothetical protein VGR73_14435 [Bryobacteraceae bacterium]|nr:hypothetical protein [Bryobacteraceae bacterium]